MSKKFSEYVLDLLHLSDEEITKRVLARPDLRTFLFPVVIEAVLMIRRNATRREERRVFRKVRYDGSGRRRAGREDDPLTNREFLLGNSFALNGTGEYVTWGEATIAQHQERVAYLNRLMNGFLVTIDQHEEAVRRIRAASAKCLLDLVEEAA